MTFRVTRLGVSGLGFEISLSWVFRFRVLGLGFGVRGFPGSGFRVRVSGQGFRFHVGVLGSEFWGRGLRFHVFRGFTFGVHDFRVHVGVGGLEFRVF